MSVSPETSPAPASSYRWKRPVSALVIVHRPALRGAECVECAGREILLLERADHPGYWQSVTGSLEAGETPVMAACRETHEETGVIVQPGDLLDWQVCREYEIFPEWRHRYAPGVTHNREHVFSLAVLQAEHIRLAPREHRAYGWFSPEQAAALCFSPSNREAIQELVRRARGEGG